MNIQVTLVIAGITIVIVVALAYYRAYLRRRAAALAGACGLFTDAIFPDECLGICAPVGGVRQQCTVLTTRPYALFGTQAATCGCRAAPPGGAAGVAPIGASTSAGG